MLKYPIQNNAGKGKKEQGTYGKATKSKIIDLNKKYKWSKCAN